MATVEESKMLIVMALPQESEGLIEKVIQEKLKNAILIYTGVGLLAAAQKTTEAILKYNPNWILNIGTAGSRKFSKCKLVECTEFIFRGEISSVIKSKYSVKPFSNLPACCCASADHVESGAQAEKYEMMDMEAFAIAKVCESYQIRFSSVKYVTDSSDETMLSDWKKNLKYGAQALADFLLTI